MVVELASTTDILIVVGNNAAPYAKDAAVKIPVVAIHISDPIGMGLVESLARPGRNITGVSNQSAEMVGKRLQLLREMIPGLTRIAVSVNPDAPVSPFRSGSVREGLRPSGIVRVACSSPFHRYKLLPDHRYKLLPECQLEHTLRRSAL
jgi:ABC-type uncharacterized transport system substrate-binding protein